MANKRISELTAAGAAAGTDLVEIETNAGASRKQTLSAIFTYISGLLGLGTSATLNIDTDTALTANSDILIASQKATKAYVDGIVAAQDAMVFKGVIDCSSNPNYPAADRGWTYRVSVAGKIGGASGIDVEAGDILLCLTDGTSSGNQATVGAQWAVIQTNLATLGTAAYLGTSTTDQILTGTSTSVLGTPDAIAALWEQGSDIASAATISIGEGGAFNVTGTTTITDIDFAADHSGRKVWLTFTGALTLTNGANLILPTGANITTAAGDTACFKSEGSDVVRCVSYQRASGAALTASPPPSTRAAQWMAAGNTTTITTVDANGFSATATATGVNTTTANKFGSFRRMVYVTSSPASNNVAGWRAPQAMWWLGNAPGLGGFRYTCRWGNHSGGTVATNRAYVGFSESISAPTDVEPSSQTNIIGMGWDAADSNVQVMHNDGSGTATKIDLGASFAVPASDSSAMYELELYAEPNASSVAYTVTDLIGGSVATGTLTTDLPSSTTLMAHRGWMSVGGTSSNIGISFCSCSIETEF